MTIPSDSNHVPSSTNRPAIGSEVAQRIEWLVEEQTATEAAQQKALLYYESAVLRERALDEAGAARDYLAAYNADSSFREPVELLSALLERRKSFKNLGRLFEALLRAASSPEQSCRAQLQFGAYLLEHQADLAGARAAFEHSVQDNPDQSAGWLELEIIAGKTDDKELRLQALEQRARLAEPVEWKALLLLDLAKLTLSLAEPDRALGYLQEALELQSPARFRLQQALEELGRREARHELVANALQAQADLILAAIEDPEAGLASGVPLYVRQPAYVADRFLRAADARNRSGDADGAIQLLDLALFKLPDSPLLLQARLLAAELAGDIETASAQALRLLDLGIKGRAGAALWLRIFEAAAARSERETAIEALAQALRMDPGCIPARSLQVDLLMDSEPAAFGASLEAMAAEGLSSEAKVRVFLLAAWAWALGAKDVPAAKQALEQAVRFGLEPLAQARVGRALSALINDSDWYEQSTQQLLQAGASEAEQASLWFELARVALLRSDSKAATTALDSLAASAGGFWMGRVLAAYALGLTSKEPEDLALVPSAQRLELLAAAEQEPSLARALRVVSAVRWVREGQRQTALEQLRTLHAADPSDLLVAALLADLERDSGAPVQAAKVLAACAETLDDTDVATALYLESAFLLWRAGQHGEAVEQLIAARSNHPPVVAPALLWATASLQPDSLDGRRRVLDLSEECGADKIAIAIERVALESQEGADPEMARMALDTLEQEALGELGVAGWLARLVSPVEDDDPEGRVRALENLEGLGIGASAIVAAERYRIARVEQQDRDAAREAAQAWALSDGTLVSSFEWLAASRAAEDNQSEAQARRLVARHLSPAGASAMQASASLLELLEAPATRHPELLEPTEAPARLLNLELAPVGCDPRRRAMALEGVDGALGDAAQLDALTLAGWSHLAAGNAEQALALFEKVTAQRASDLAAWEGVRASAELLNNREKLASACERLGELCVDASRAATFLETAGLLWIDQLRDEPRGERALDAAFERDPGRTVAFDRLFRRVRARDENDYLLQIISRRLQVAENTTEIAKLFWEQARVLRQKGDFDGAMSALENVTMLEPDHVGALALSGEVHIRRGEFKQAVDMLERLVSHPEAPAQQRLVSGMAAVDLCENRLSDMPRALAVLLTMHRVGLSTQPVRERLARAAAQNGAWKEATGVLELLMNERSTAQGRIEAARLAMVIYRDKLGDAPAAFKAVTKLLEESPADTEALTLLMDHADLGEGSMRTRLLDRARRSLVESASTQLADADSIALLARIAKTQQNLPLRQATLGALAALGRAEDDTTGELQALDERVAKTPQVAIDDAAIAAIGDPRDSGPIADLFRLLAETITDALGPTLAGLAVTKRERIDARDGHPLRNEIAHWAGALGISEFELYIGGREPKAVVGVPGESPVLVVGNQITAPLNPQARQAVARELFALRRGISVVRTRDEATVASIVIAACRIAEVPIEAPPYAMLAEVQRLMAKSLSGGLMGNAQSRRVRKALPEVCRAVAASRAQPISWVPFALSSLDRMAAIAAGDVSLVLSDVFSTPRERLGALCTENERARRLISFVLSDRYLELRSQLGMRVR